MSNREIRQGRPAPDDDKPTITEMECARRMTVHAARVQLFAAAQMCETAGLACADMAELQPKVRDANAPPPLEQQLGVVALAAKEFICKKMADLGLLDSVPAPHAENDNGPAPDGPKIVR